MGPLRSLPAPKRVKPTCGATSKQREACVDVPGHRGQLHKDRFGRTFTGDARRAPVRPLSSSAAIPQEMIRQVPAAGRPNSWLVTAGGKERVIEGARDPREAEDLALKQYGSVQGKVRPAFYQRQAKEGERVFPAQADRFGRLVPAPLRSLGLATKRVEVAGPPRPSGKPQTVRVWDEQAPAPAGVDWRDWAHVKARLTPEQVAGFRGAGLTNAEIVALLRAKRR